MFCLLSLQPQVSVFNRLTQTPTSYSRISISHSITVYLPLYPFMAAECILWTLERAKETLTWFWISLKFSVWSLKQSRTLISPDIAPKLKEAYTMSKLQLCFNPQSIQISFFLLLFYFLKPLSELFQPAVICHFFNNWMTIITATFWGRTQVAEY